MADVFDTTSSGSWTYTASASRILNTTTLALGESGVQFADWPDIAPRHDAAYWTKATRGFDFTAEDRVPADLFNEVLWEGLAGGRAYPAVRTGLRLGARAARD